MFKAALVGMRYHGASFAKDEVIPGNQIVLERQPANEHDNNAIAVKIRNSMVGHVDRESACILAPLLDSAAIYEVSELKVEQSNAASMPLRITLTYFPEKIAAPQLANGRRAGIYEIGIRSGDRRYVGQARVINERLSRHWDDLALGVHPNPLLQELWRKLGGVEFHASVLELAPDDLTELALSRWLYDRECHWINEHQARSGVFNRVPPEMVMSAGAKTEMTTEAQARLDQKKQQRLIDKEREPIIKSELVKLRSQTTEVRRSLFELDSQIRNLSGIRGRIFASATQRNALPRLQAERDKIETRLRLCSDELAKLTGEHNEILQRRRAAKPRRPSKYVSEFMVMSRSRPRLRYRQ